MRFVLILAEPVTHLLQASVVLSACLCGQPCAPWLCLLLRRQGGLPQSLLLLWETLLQQVLLLPPSLSLSGRHLDLQEFDDMNGLSVPCVGWAGWANAVR